MPRVLQFVDLQLDSMYFLFLKVKKKQVIFFYSAQYLPIVRFMVYMFIHLYYFIYFSMEKLQDK